MLEKTFSTFYASNINLQQQYRLQNFKRYSDLNVNLLVAEKNNELLMKNHQSRPTGSLALPEANAVNNNDNKNSGSKRRRGNPRGSGRGHYGHNHFPNRNYTYHRGGYNSRGRGRVKRVRLDNAGEFTSHAFNDYCMSIGIIVEHLVAHVHTQNSLVESLIKRLQLIARPLIMRTKLPVSMWGHAILHVASLIRMRPSANHKYSLVQLALAKNQTFPILEFLVAQCDLFTVRFADCHFDETVFPELGGVKKNQEKDVIWCEPTLLYLDPRTKQYTKRVTKSHISAANAPSRVEIPNKQAGENVAQKSQERLKRGRPIGSKDKNPRKRKGTEKNSDHDENVLNETQDIKTSPEEEMNNINKKSSDIMSGDDDPEPKSVIDCHSRPDWDKWKDAMQAELNSLKNQKVFGPIVTTPRDVKLKTTFEFVIIAVYVDDLNIIGTNKEINEVVMHLKEEFEMKDLEDEDVLGPEVPYLSAIGALVYLTNCTRPDISFAVNLLARFSSSPTKRHWNGIKHIFQYLQGTTDLGLFYSDDSKQGLVGYADFSQS
ncbi:retrovirus-related pol polyprotein from transposon TNT 1-94 [Tanacetum coccineum]